jgi:hypothetical protein
VPVSFKGGVKVQRGGELVPYDGAPLRAGERLVMGRDGRGYALLPDGSLVQLGPDSTFELTHEGGRLEKGLLYIEKALKRLEEGRARPAHPGRPQKLPSEPRPEAVPGHGGEYIPSKGQSIPPNPDKPLDWPEPPSRDASERLRRSQGLGSSEAREPAAKPDPKPFQNAPENVGGRPAGPPPAMDDAARAPAVIMERSPAPAGAPPPPDVAAGTAAEARRAPPPQARPAPSRAMRSERDMSREDAAGSVSGGLGAPAPRAAEAPRAPGELAAQKRESVPPMPPRVAAMVKELDGQPPEKWLERMQALRREGQAAEARDLLAEFKRRYPAHPLPPELQ